MSTLHGRAAVEVSGTVLVRAAALARFVLIGRLFTPDQYGAFATALVLLILPQLLSQAGFRSYLVRQDDEGYGESFGTAAVVALAAVLGLYGLLVVAAGPAEAILDQPGLAPLLLLVGVGLVDTLWQLPEAALERRLSFGRARLFQAAGLVAGIVVLVATARAGVIPEWCMAVSFVTSSLVRGGLLLVGSGPLPSLRPRWERSRDLLGFSLPLVASAALGYVASRGDDLAVRWFYGTGAMGLYVLAFYLPSVLADLVLAVNRVSLPIFSRLTDRHELAAAFGAGVRLSATLALPVGFGVALFAPQVVDAAFGDAWVEAAPLLAVFSVSFALRSATGINWTALALLEGRTRYMAFTTLLSALLLLVVGWPLIRWLGPMGGAIYTFVDLAVLSPLVRFPVIRDSLGDLSTLRGAAEPLLVSGGAGAALWAVGATRLSTVPALGVAALYVMGCLAVLLARDPDLRRRFARLGGDPAP